ncbi:ADP-ribosylation [Pluteus cervinus]|uniref:ADP-ribosylation n=1 Tax=Pluteus cervinus TaxID=181527 RepID=A0ACD3AWJ6_9AGAR|nr:ADP-ribosylation [Pluteus cervinus]
MEDYVTDFNAALSIDEFSFDNPKNKAGGKWNRLKSLRRSDADFARIEQLFQKGWRHQEKSKRWVSHIFKVLSSDDILRPYLEYRTQVHSASAARAPFQTPGNEQLLFHGTTRCCLLAENEDSVRLCGLPDCFLCCIIRKSFDVRKCGSKHKFRRFGTGIYSTGCSSKADDYVANKNEKARFRVVLVNRVVVGKAFKRKHNAVNLTRAPTGHHSVHGEPGVDLNYEETVVYDNDAIRPAYIVVYGDPPARPPSKVKALFSLFKTPLAS